ncbi:hypothetical protein ABID23_000176 [Bartonella silvatica]|uniref:Uncharacterized protein n=1 Tax=Bartonella silvatica TaxID=357760 RepID=A0ABV2HEY3_9HYPH
MVFISAAFGFGGKVAKQTFGVVSYRVARFNYSKLE